MRGLHAHRVTGGHQHHRCVGQFDRWIVRTGGAQEQRSTDPHGNDSVASPEIENYKSAIGSYPPDNPGRPSTNQLFYELSGTFFQNNNFYVYGRQEPISPAAIRS